MRHFRASTVRAELIRTLRLGLPLIGAQLLQISNGLVDAIIAGRLGRAELAAGGIGASLWFVASLMCIGLMAGLSPTLSRLIGQGRRAYVGRVFRQGLWLAVATGMVALAVLVLVRNGVDQLGFEPDLPPLIDQYLYGAMWGMPFVAVVMAARNVCEATGMARPVVLVTAIGLCINALASSVLGFGLWGFPALGLLGIGIATSLVNISMAVVLLMILRGKRFSTFALFSSLEWPQWEYLKPMLVLSIPIFFTLLFETGLFVATSVQMGMIGIVEAGAHQIALSASAICYMLPLGMSFALTARIGRVAGNQDVSSMYLRMVSGAILTLAMALTTAILLVTFRYSIASVYTNDPVLINFAATLLLLGALFQLSDGTQVMLIGMLRGLHDTHVPMYINAFSYWVVAFGLGWFSAHRLGFGAYGLWFGLITGLSIASALLAWRLQWMLASGKFKHNVNDSKISS